MAATPKLPSNFQIKDVVGAATTNNKELRITNLYLHHACREPSSENLTILNNPDGHQGFDAAPVVFKNWAIYNKPDPNEGSIVGHAQGLHIQSVDLEEEEEEEEEEEDLEEEEEEEEERLHIQSGRSHISFNVAFQIDGLRDSTLHVMGLGDQNSDYWSIVGGTGKFALAKGFIYRRHHKSIDTGDIIELDIYAIFRLTKVLIRDGPKGATSAVINHEPKYEPHQLKSIKIGHNDYICAVVYTYIDQTGTKRTDSLRGYTDSKTVTIELGSDEFVKEISGTTGKYATSTVVTSIKIVTNIRTYGPYGKESENTFSLPEKKVGSVVGFIGWAGAVVDSIGVIIRL